jgi:hypothetical protein
VQQQQPQVQQQQPPVQQQQPQAAGVGRGGAQAVRGAPAGRGGPAPATRGGVQGQPPARGGVNQGKF